MLAEARPIRTRLALSIALGACAIGAGIGLLSTSGYLISKAALAPPVLSLGVAIAGVRFFGISRGVFRYFERLVSHDAAFRFLARLRVAFYERIEPLVPSGLGTTKSGDLLSRFVSDVDSLQFLFLRALAPPLVALAAAVVAVAVAVAVLPSAGLVLAVGLLGGGIVASLITAFASAASARREAPARAELANEIVDLLTASPELVAFGRVEHQLARVEQTEKRVNDLGAWNARIASLGEAVVTLAAGLTLVATLAIAAPAVRDGTLAGVWLGMLALLVLASFEGVRALPLAAQHLSTSAKAAERLYELVDRAPPVADPERSRSLPAAALLSLEGARLRYDERGPWVLDGVDLTLEPGKKIALTGPSGAGKTTIASVLVRFRDLDGGRATLDGHDLRDYAQDDLRRLVALAGQDAHLFSTTIRENVRFARPEASDEEIARALARAGAWEWVDSLPEGLDTYVGERGDQVSGGQRQRIALARAFLSGARLLILDEPIAHLDRRTAEAVMDDLLRAAGDAGLLVITHDPLALERFDRVLRLENGRIV